MRTRGTVPGLALLLLAATLSAQEPAVTEGRRGSADEASQPVVRGVLFYSPTCPHCREVMTETLPPVMARYGEQLQIAAVNVTTPGGQALYQAVVDYFQLPRDRLGVPTLVVGSRTLVGGYEIPSLLPEITDRALAADGIDWPEVPLIRQALAAQGVAVGDRSGPAVPSAPRPAPDPDTAVPTADTPPVDTPPVDSAPATPNTTRPPASAQSDTVGGSRAAPSDTAESRAASSDMARSRVTPSAPEARPAAEPPAEEARAERTEEDPEAMGGDAEETRLPSEDELAAAFDTSVARTIGLRDRFLLDPAGNATAVAVLILMLVVLGLVAADAAGRIRVPRWPGWTVPALAVLGAGVAAYLTYVEATGAEAICGPVGDCNTVQQSSFARLFGVVPVGALGLVGYALMITAWAAARYGSASVRPSAAMSLWLLALAAVLFSLYLTFLEPFVIGASCAWCLTSAGATTLILLAATADRPVREAAPAAPIQDA